VFGKKAIVRKRHHVVATAADSLSNLAAAKPGDILLFDQPKGGLGAIISLVTRSSYYHVAIFEGETFTIEARQRGVVRRDLRTKEGGHIFTVIPAPDGKGQLALDWACAKIGAKFDRLDFLVILIDRVFTRLRLRYQGVGAYSCGEFVAKAYSAAGVRLFPDLDDDDVEPADFVRFLPPGRKDRRRLPH
jgi:uncharacterized protein YycO